MKEYCIACGFANEYLSVRPKFCGGCGAVLNRAAEVLKSKASNSTPAKVKRKSIFVNNDEDEDEDENFEDLQIDKRELVNSVEAVVSAPRFPTFEDLAIHSASPRKERFSRPEFRVEGGDVVAATRRECAKVQTSREVSGN